MNQSSNRYEKSFQIKDVKHDFISFLFLAKYWQKQIFLTSIEQVYNDEGL